MKNRVSFLDLINFLSCQQGGMESTRNNRYLPIDVTRAPSQNRVTHKEEKQPASLQLQTKTYPYILLEKKGQRGKSSRSMTSSKVGPTQAWDDLVGP
jgi:hypothetical protein